MALPSQDLQAVIPEISSIKLVLLTSFKLIKQFYKHDGGRTRRTLKYLEEWCNFIRLDFSVDDVSNIFRGGPGTENQETHQTTRIPTTISNTSTGPTKLFPSSIEPGLDAFDNLSNVISSDFDNLGIFDPRSLLLAAGREEFWSNTGFKF